MGEPVYALFKVLPVYLLGNVYVSVGSQAAYFCTFVHQPVLSQILFARDAYRRIDLFAPRRGAQKR